mmetsp:Transcript_8298/g.24923  ORF Transcript_8298/g.24923 Transcript_8298/m.24923 type:complete len:929 (+) Transcript_8298:92-2878(+)
MARVVAVDKDIEANGGVDESSVARNVPPADSELDDFKICPLSHHYQPEVDWRSMTNKRLATSKEIFSKEFAEVSFNQRVLHAALDAETPLLERFKFLCIVASNLDEIYAKRLGNIPKFDEEDEEDRTKNYKRLIRPKTQFEEELAEAVRYTMDLLYKCLLEQVLPKLKELGVEIIRRKQLSAEQRSAMTAFFKRKILPILTPLSVDQTHPFPLLQSHGIYLAIVLLNPETSKTRRVYLRVPRIKPRALAVNADKTKYIPIEEVVMDNMHLVCEGMEVIRAYPFRVTRNVKLVIDDAYFGESDNLLDFVWEEVHRRRSAPATRLEVPKDMPEDFRLLLVKELILDSTDVFVLPCHLVGLADFMSISFTAPLPEHRDPVHVPQVPQRFDGLEEKLQTDPGKVFSQIHKHDVLVEYPKHSFKHSSALFLRASARDPKVRVIKCCLYRGGEDSPLVASLIRAAKSGKEVSVLVELKASFDEVQNSEYARKLRRSGCNVSYGLLGLKAHCKLILVVREEEGVVRPYVNIATGNFNPGTARVYTDQSFFTCREDICADVIDLYNALFGYSRKRNYRRLLVAPVNMLSGFLGLIRKEIAHAEKGEKAHIIVQVNGLTEPSIVAELYTASQVGVKVDLIVRGVCLIRPGLPGKSENINVYSWIGRFLQHQRIFYFYDGGKEQVYIGSADWRGRNLNDRIEVCCPVDDAKLRKKLHSSLTFFLRDTRNTWQMASDGRYYFRKNHRRRETDIRILPNPELEDDYAVREVIYNPLGDSEDDMRRVQVRIAGVQETFVSAMHLCAPIRAVSSNGLEILHILQSKGSEERDGGLLKLITVHVDPSENLIDAVRRQVEEDAGVTGEVVDYIAWQRINDSTAADLHIFRVDVEEEWSSSLKHERRWLSLDEALLAASADKNELRVCALESVKRWYAQVAEDVK